VTLLTSLLPGIRELRSPISIGLLWLCAVVLKIHATWPRVTASNPGLKELDAIVADLPDGVKIAMIAFGAYLLGCITSDISRTLGRHNKRVARRLLRLIYDFRRMPGWISRRAWKLQSMMDFPPRTVHSSLYAAVKAAYAKTGAPGGAHFCFPQDYLSDELNAMALQLKHRAPDLYDEYDRLRGEADFRGGIVAPVIGLGAVLASMVTWMLLPVVVYVAAALAWQSHKVGAASVELVAMSLYLGNISAPILESLAEELGGMRLPKNAGIGTWAGATIVALERFGQFDAADASIDETLAFFEDESEVLEECIEYLQEHSPTNAALFIGRRGEAR
jgi:hypothetical protein